jgi:prophage antirepressor-like protein
VLTTCILSFVQHIVYNMALSKQTFYLNDQPIEVKFIVERIDEDAQFWFAAKEFAKAMGYEKPQAAFEKVDAKYRKKYEQFGQPREMATHAIQPSTVFVNEPGLYQMVLSSKLKNVRVEQFKSWVFEVVLPTIRKTGRYKMTEAVVPSAQQEENKQLITKLIASFTDHTKALQAIVAQKNQELVKKQESIEHIVAMKDKQIEVKDLQVTRVMTDLNRMYAGFQETMQRKDAQVTELVSKVVDLSGRAVQYPVDKNKHPILCVAREGTTFHAIAGQHSYVAKQKNKRGLNNNDIVLETKRPNPTLDWNNAVHEADTNFDKNGLKKKKRSLGFDSEDDAQQFENKLKYLLNLDLIKK